MYFMKILWLLLGIFSVCYAQSENICTNHRNVRGECIVINKCPSLFSILQHRPIKSIDADHLRRSQCGFEGRLPKVCCPLEDTLESTTNTPPNISDSPLLPSKDQCGSSTEDKVRGGEKAGLGEFPWMALLELGLENGQSGFVCGGVLISSRYILTAAHCIKGKDLPRFSKIVSVRLGEYDTDNDTDCILHGKRNICAPAVLDIPVEESIAHELYNPFDINQYHDIGLLRLASKVDTSRYVKPICLPKSSFDQSIELTGKNLTVAGWGRTSEEKNETTIESHVLLKLNVPVREDGVCSRSYTQAGVNLRSGQFCAGGLKGKDSCKGDSGGPLMSLYADENNEINWYSIGVVSFGPSPCGTESWPGVYTKVTNYIPWIIGKLRA